MNNITLKEALSKSLIHKIKSHFSDDNLILLSYSISLDKELKNKYKEYLIKPVIKSTPEIYVLPKDIAKKYKENNKVDIEIFEILKPYYSFEEFKKDYLLGNIDIWNIKSNYIKNIGK